MAEVSPRIDKVGYVILFVKDVEASVAFYRDKVGVPVRSYDPHWSELATQGTTIALHGIDASNADKAGPSQGSEIVFAVEDVLGVRKILKERGVAVEEPKVVHEAGPEMVGVSCMFRDPDGNLCSVYGLAPRAAVA